MSALLTTKVMTIHCTSSVIIDLQAPLLNSRRIMGPQCIITGLTLTTGVPYSCRNVRGANNLNIHYEVTSLLTVLIAHMRDIQESAGSRQLDRRKCQCIG